MIINLFFQWKDFPLEVSATLELEHIMENTPFITCPMQSLFSSGTTTPLQRPLESEYPLLP